MMASTYTYSYNLSGMIEASNLIAKAEECERMAKELMLKAEEYRRQANIITSNNR